jgi:hypothetical protein
MENKLRQVFEYQRFENNSRLSSMLAEALERNGFSNEGELSDDDAGLLNAAGQGFTRKGPGPAGGQF